MTKAVTKAVTISLSDPLPHIDEAQPENIEDYEWSEAEGAWVLKEDPTQEAKLKLLLYWFLLFEEEIETKINRATDRLLADKLTLVDWQLLMGQELQHLYRFVAILGTGNLDPETIALLNQEVEFHAQRLNQFATDLTNGTMTADQVRSRARLYPKAAVMLFFVLQEESRKKAGYRFSQRFLGDAEHCPDCIRYVAMGKRPIGELPVPGKGSVCMFYCHCRIEYFRD